MAAVLRVKRRNEDEPINTLLVHCKRKKPDPFEDYEAIESTPPTAIVKFAGTIRNQEENVVEHIRKTLTKDGLKNRFTQRSFNVSGKVRRLRKKASQENRYKIINCIRSIDTSEIEELAENVLSVIDIEDSISCSANNQDENDEEEDDYVYDLYYTHTSNGMEWEHLESVQSVNETFIFDEYRDEEYGFHTDDSNSESNWRNDYPDSDHSAGSIGEADMLRAVRKMNVEDDLSTDDEDYAYGLDEEDVEKYGSKYAKYKARMKKEENEDDSIEVSDLSAESEKDCSDDYS